MRRTHYIVVALTMLAILIPLVSAATNGLTWGVATGDRFDFTMNVSCSIPGYESEIQEDFYVIIGSLSSLDFPPSTYIPPVSAQWYWANGSEIFNSYEILFEFEAYLSVIPVGNWTHMNEILAPTLEWYEGELIDNLAVWGYILTFASLNTEIRLEVSKIDGVPNLMRVLTTEGSENVLTIEISRRGLPTLLLIGIGGAAVIVIVAVIFLKKR